MQKEFKTYIYSKKEDYDKKLKINGGEVLLYSQDKVDDLYPDDTAPIAGETWDGRKRDRDKDIGKIELADKLLYVTEKDSHNKLFKSTVAYAETEDGFLIAILKTRLLLFIILLAIILVAIGVVCGISLAPSCYGTGSKTESVDPDKVDPNIETAAEIYYTISGTVMKEGKPVANAKLSLKSGSTEIGTTITKDDGTYIFENVSSGVYNVVCTVGNSVLTKLADVRGQSVIVDFTFPKDDLSDVEEISDYHEKEKLPETGEGDETSNVKAIIKVEDGTPAIAVGGLDREAILHMEYGKEVDITLIAKQLSEEKVPEKDREDIEAISGELTMTYFDFSVLKEVFKDQVLESSEYLTVTKTVLEVAVPFDSRNSAGTYAFRCHGGEAEMLEQLSEKPSGDFTDGTYYTTVDTVYIYTNKFCTYAIGCADAGQVAQGSDMLIFGNGAEVDVANGTITMYYSHDADATHDARVEIYLTGKEEDLLLGTSGIIPPGNELSVMPLAAAENRLPSDDSYEGKMLITYLNSDGTASDTRVELPITVTIKRQ